MQFEVYVGDADVEINSNEILERVRSEFGPDDVFLEDTLAEWAEVNGFIRKEDARQYVLEQVKK